MGKRERNQKIAHNGRHPYIQKHKVIKVKLKLIVTTWQLRSCILINQYAVGWPDKHWEMPDWRNNGSDEWIWNVYQF